MKNSVRLMLTLFCFTLLWACGSGGGATGSGDPVGVEAVVQGSNVILKNMRSVEGIRDSAKLIVRSSNEDFVGKVDTAVPDNKFNKFMVKNGKNKLPFSVFRKMKNGEEKFVLSVSYDPKVPDRLKIGDKLVVGMTQPNGLSPLDQSASNKSSDYGAIAQTGKRVTFDVCGEIKATSSGDQSVIGYSAVKISINFYNESDGQGVRLVQYYRNLKDAKYYPLDDYHLGNGVYAITINANLGNSFGFVNADGKDFNIFARCMRLISGLSIDDKNQLLRVNMTNKIAKSSSNSSAKTKSKKKAKKKDESVKKDSEPEPVVDSVPDDVDDSSDVKSETKTQPVKANPISFIFRSLADLGNMLYWFFVRSYRGLSGGGE